MKAMFVLLLSCLTGKGCSQHNTGTEKVQQTTYENIGGRCEGCEAIYESPVSFEKLSWADTLPDFNEPGPKLEISGTVYQKDGKIPAAGVVLYVYHTDQ